jgi:hypothetical protein
MFLKLLKLEEHLGTVAVAVAAVSFPWLRAAVPLANGGLIRYFRGNLSNSDEQKFLKL